MRIAFQTEAQPLTDEELTRICELHEIKPEKYLIQSMRSLIDHREEIDAKISECLTGWSFDRLPRVDRAILRVGVNEICFTKLAPINVAINEAVELAKKYADKDSYRFINGLLSTVAKEEGKE